MPLKRINNPVKSFDKFLNTDGFTKTNDNNKCARNNINIILFREMQYENYHEILLITCQNTQDLNLMTTWGIGKELWSNWNLS